MCCPSFHLKSVGSLGGTIENYQLCQAPEHPPLLTWVAVKGVALVITVGVVGAMVATIPHISQCTSYFYTF